VKLDGSTVLIDALKGDLDGASFNGNASVDLESKPQVKVNLDLARIGITRAAVGDTGTPAASSTQPAAPQPWNDKPFDLRGLNYVDAQTHLSIGELDIGAIKIAPLEVEATLADGIVRGTASKIGIYEGLAAAGIALDASADTPSFALRAELRQVHALPLLSSAADFTRLDGKLDATVNVQAIGGSQRDIVGNLSGIAVTKFQDGEIRGINVAKMIRALTNGSLAGWQEGQSETTDLTELGASFQIDHGQAQTQDFKLAGPLVRVTGIGTADLNTKAINFRLEPKLVMSIQGQGAGADPIGFGVPVMVQGPWNQPRFFLDMAGILDNPDAAYAQLRQLGQGLFGSNLLQPNGATGNTPNANNPAGNNVMNSIGNLIQGLTGKPNQTPTAGQNAAPQQAPAQGQQPAPAQGQTAQSGAANPAQAPSQAQGAPNGATGQQQTGGPAAGQPATGGGLGQILGPQQKGQLDQIMQNLFGSGGSNGSSPSK
jgi:AsmA protein